MNEHRKKELAEIATEEKYETRFCGEIELREKDGVATGLRGYAAVFDVESEDFGGWKEVVDRGAFAKDINEGADIRALINHDSGRVIGRTAANTLRLEENDRGLLVDIDLPDTTEARDLAVNVRAGNISGMSFGFIVRNATWEEREKYDVRHLRDVELFEVSAVAFPAYPQTSIGTRSHNQFLANRRKPKTRSVALALRELEIVKQESI